MPIEYIPATRVEEVLITAELCQRKSRQPEREAEARAYSELAETFTHSAKSTLQALVDAGVRLCGAGSCGLSVLRTAKSGEPEFYWSHMAGVYAGYVGGTTPRDFSPCGTTLDRRSPQLFHYPGRLFSYFQPVQPPLVEGLVLPLMLDHVALGTIWIVSHDDERKFDSEDVRVMTSLAYFTVAALRVQSDDMFREFAAD